MDFSFSDEQQMLLDTTRRFLARDYDFERRARLLARNGAASRDTWRQLADLGLLAVDIAEDDGGIGAGAVGTMLVAQAMGEALVLEPFMTSAVVATAAITQLGSEAQRAHWLPQLSAGDVVAVLALDEGALLDASALAVDARVDGGGWRLDGVARMVYHAASAELLLVPARLQDGSIALFALPAGTPGIGRDAFTTVDDQPAAHVVFDAVAATRDTRLGDDATDALHAALDRGLAALCADALGTLDRILKATIDYSRARVQFGAPIGSFQALQHRMADMLMQVEQARSMVYLATSHCTDANARTRRRALSGAKVLIGQAARRVGQEAVQLHGGMGMTDELDVSHCFKRLLAFELRFGTTDAHLEAYRLLPAE